MKFFNKIYDIDFTILANLLMPPFLRKKRLIEWLVVLLAPLENVNFQFKKFRKQAIYKVTHNGQVFSLQAVLNDSYDNTERRIKIVDSLVNDPLYVYPEEDNKPVFVYDEAGNNPVFVYDDSIFENIDVDFLVLIPLEYRPFEEKDLNLLLLQIRSLINYYKLASKRYRILWI